MASVFLRKPSLGASPLQGLADYFEKARKRAGTIILPDNTLQTIKDYRAQGSEHSAEEVETIVQAVEQCDPQLCMRLDAKGLVIICSVLVHSQTCLAQQRGLYLLAEALYTSLDRPGSQSEIADRKTKKAALGFAALTPLIKGFAAHDSSDQTRRWMGVLALELLKDCEKNAAILKTGYSELKWLSAVMKHARCQVLKLLAGSMINVMLNNGVIPKHIWADKTDNSVFASFPRGEQQDTQWVTSFEGYIEGLKLDDTAAQQRSSVIFAYALYIGDKRYNTDQESAILVTVSEDLNIIIPESTMGPSMYIDVPLKAISSIAVEGQANSQSQSICYASIMQLSSDTEQTCYLNAAAKNYGSIALAFVSESDARTLARLLQPTASSEAMTGRLSVSEGIAVSQLMSDDQSSSPSPQDNQDLMATASRATSFVARNPPPNPNQPQSQISHKDFVSKLRQSQCDAGEAPRTISVDFGIDVTQTKSTNDIQTKTGLNTQLSDTRIQGISNYHVFTDGDSTKRKIPDGFQHTSDTGLSSSMRQHKGFEAIENAPEFRQIEDHSRPHKAAHHGRTGPSEKSIQQQQSLPVSIQEPNNFSENKLDIISNHFAKSPEPPIASGPQDTPSMQVVEADDSKTQDQHPENPQATKLSRRLQNGTGKVEEPSADSESNRSALIGRQLKAKAKPLPKEDAMAPKKTNFGAKKQTMTPKKAKVTKCREKATLEQLEDGNDEYELQDSPESSPRPAQSNVKKGRKNAELGAATKSQRKSGRVPAAKIARAKRAKQAGHEEDPESNTGLVPDDKTREESQDAKAKQEQIALGRPKPKPKTKPAPTASIQQRPRREAAMKANAKIQGVKADGETTNVSGPDEEATAFFPSRNVIKDRQSMIPRVSEQTSKLEKKGKADAVHSRTLRPAASGKAEINSKTPSSRHKLNPPREGLPTSVSGSGNSDKVELVGEPSRSRCQDTKVTNTAANPMLAQFREPTKSGGKTPSTEPSLPIDEHYSMTDEQEGVAEQAFVPNSVPSIHNTSLNGGEQLLEDPTGVELPQPDQFSMMGDAEDSHFQEAMGGAREGPFLSLEPGIVPRKAKNTLSSPETTQITIPKQKRHVKVPTTKSRENPQVEDPFGTRLGSLVSPVKAVKKIPNQIDLQEANVVPKASESPNAEALEEDISLPAAAKTQSKKTSKAVKHTKHVVDESRLEDGEAGDTIFPGPSVGGKRKLEKDDKKQTKKVKLAPHNKSLTEGLKVDEGTNAKTPITVNKKPELISWDASGPRNQGTTSAKSHPLSEDVKAPLDHPPLGQPLGLKRKTTPYQNDPAQPVKRQKQDFVTPSQSRNHVPQMIAEPTTSIRQQRAHRLSSQSQKVDENGSPLPVSQPHIGNEVPIDEVEATTLVLNEDENTGGNDDGYDLSEPHFPAANDHVQHEEETVQSINVTSKGKQFPSSPYAESTLTTIPPHLILSSGEMVNRQTLESIVPTLPQDPFVGGAEKPPSSFVKMLRKSTDGKGQHEDDEANKGQPSIGLKRKSIGNKDEDPDKTLVEPQPEPKPKRRRSNRKVVLQPSTSSSLTSVEVSPAEVEPEEEAEDETLKWLTTLEPHQANVLDILTVITHRLVRHLVDKETAIKDIIKDYEIRGKNLLKGYEQERQKALAADRDGLNHLKSSLSLIYLGAQDNLRTISREATERKTRKTNKLQARLEEQEKNRTIAINAAIAGCFD